MDNFNPESSQIPPIYGASALYTEQPQGDDARDGVIPLDTLPAQWWNWLWNNITNYCNSIVQPELVNIFTELSNVLAAENITPDDVTPNQLATAVIKIHERIATAQTAGSVKSSDDKGKVSVDSSTGVMTANGLGNIDNLTTTIKTSVVAAVNELKSTIDNIVAGAVTGVKGNNESSYRIGQVNLTPSDIGAQPAGSYQPAGDYKTTQTAVTDPTADGNSTTFIDTISQDANGVITPTKKSVNFPVTKVNNKTGVVSLTASDVGAKPTQTAVTDPTADGNSTTFIDTISQDANGVITPTKKSVNFPVTKVNGKTGAVSLTPSDIGAQPAGSYQPAGNYKSTQTAVTDPTADGNSTTFIDSISQDANGVITATKKSVRNASYNRLGLVSLQCQISAEIKRFTHIPGSNVSYIDIVSDIPAILLFTAIVSGASSSGGVHMLKVRNRTNHSVIAVPLDSSSSSQGVSIPISAFVAPAGGGVTEYTYQSEGYGHDGIVTILIFRGSDTSTSYTTHGVTPV